MKPISLTMQAFGSYGKATTIDFTVPHQNLFLICGDTGSGKSTIFDAIAFALYGEASSSSNKKDGRELISQFAGMNIEPFVELTFSDNSNGTDELYVVHRSPRHDKLTKRTNGIREVHEFVSLTMPDGTDYPGKQEEVQKKIQEIIGLSKKQFMQVAMIAQGEFLEVLRAPSKDKKAIFRNLFKTEQYEQITRKLEERYKGLEKEVESVQKLVKVDAGKISIPASYEDEDLKLLQGKILMQAKPPITDMENFADRLAVLCDYLKEETIKTENAYKEAQKARDQVNNEFQAAKILSTNHTNYENAVNTLNMARIKEPYIQELDRRVLRVRKSYELHNLFTPFDAASKAYDATYKELTQLGQDYPILVNSFNTAFTAYQKAKAAYDDDIKTESSLRQQCQDGRNAFATIDGINQRIGKLKMSLSKAQADAENVKKEKEALTAREKQLQKILDDTKDLETRRQLFKTNEGKLTGWNSAVTELKTLESGIPVQKKKVQDAANQFMLMQQEVARQDAFYRDIYNRFLNAQAGILAMGLTPNTPCPVCGSIHHPAPSILKDEDKMLHEDYVQGLKANLDAANASLMALSKASGDENQKLMVMEETYARQLKALQVSTGRTDPLSGIEIFLSQCRKYQESEKEKLDTAEKERNKAQKEFDQLGTLKQALEVRATTAEATLNDLKIGLASASNNLETIKKTLPFQSIQQIDEMEKQLSQNIAVISANFTAAENKEKELERQKITAEGRIKQLKDLIPLQQAEVKRTQDLYTGALLSFEMDENTWKATVQQFQKDTSGWEKEIQDFSTSKDAAEKYIASMTGSMEGKRIPDMETIQKKFQEAEEALRAADTVRMQCRETYNVNASVLASMKSHLEDRHKISEDYECSKALFDKFAGKVSGSRMDIETFVQRYYLQQILQAANQRLAVMCDEQYELRMCELEKAGDGRNKGLDLMVYSPITNQEREVRTLSGGESFMAALSLALGMADQIQNSGAIHLDMLYIDEGFGSLDARARSQAVKVLQQLAGESRTVGIISHVQELKQEIDDQLIVTKDAQGSHVKWNVA